MIGLVVRRAFSRRDLPRCHVDHARGSVRCGFISRPDDSQRGRLPVRGGFTKLRLGRERRIHGPRMKLRLRALALGGGQRFPRLLEGVYRDVWQVVVRRRLARMPMADQPTTLAEIAERRDREVGPLGTVGPAGPDGEARVRRRLASGVARLVTRATVIARRFIALNGTAPRRLASLSCARWDAFRTVCLDLLPARRSAFRSGRAMPRSVLVLNLGMAGLAVFLSIRIGQALIAPDPHPPSRVVRPVVVTSPRNQDVVTKPRSGEVYDVIATRTLFHPNRAEPTRSEPVALTLPPPPALALHGVVINGDTSLAYLEDVATKQIFGYKAGDKLAGGQVERIEPDRVVIMRADGPIEVRLHRSKEPQPVVPAPQEDSPRRSRGRQE